MPKMGSSSGLGFSKTYELGGAHAFLVDHQIDGRILMPVILLLRQSCMNSACKPDGSLQCYARALPAQSSLLFWTQTLPCPPSCRPGVSHLYFFPLQACCLRLAACVLFENIVELH